MPLNDQSKYERIAFFLCALVFGAWVYVLIYKYTHLGYYDWDLAFNTQACWQLVHGSQFVSLFGINYFGDHASFITLLILPFFALFPHPLTLVFLKLAAFIISAFLLYRIFLRGLGPWVAMGLMLGYILLPANLFALLYEFSPESLAVPFIVLMVDSFEQRRWKGFWISFFCLVLVKENLPLLTAAFGIYGWSTAKDGAQKKHAQLVLMLSILIFWFFAFVLTPYFRHLPTHAHAVRYQHLGGDMGEVFSNILRNPGMFILHYILSSRHLPFLAQLFGFWLIPSLLGFPLLLVCLPILLQHMLSTNMQEHTIYYYYGMTIAPIIFLSVYKGLCFLKPRLRPILFTVTVSVLLLASILNLKDYAQDFKLRINVHQDSLNQKRWELIRSVPSQEGVVATFEFLAPLALRDGLYSFHKVFDDFYQAPEQIKKSELNLHERFVLPEGVSYALIDFSDPWLVSRLRKDPKIIKPRIFQFLSEWRPLRREGNIYLYIRH